MTRLARDPIQSTPTHERKAHVMLGREIERVVARVSFSNFEETPSKYREMSRTA